MLLEAPPAPQSTTSSPRLPPRGASRAGWWHSSLGSAFWPQGSHPASLLPFRGLCAPIRKVDEPGSSTEALSDQSKLVGYSPGKGVRSL
jgi:hypothetical protein